MTANLDAVYQAVADLLPTVDPTECANYFVKPDMLGLRVIALKRADIPRAKFWEWCTETRRRPAAGSDLSGRVRSALGQTR